MLRSVLLMAGSLVCFAASTMRGKSFYEGQTFLYELVKTLATAHQ